ncbi:MAG TPA: hypothetical protein VMV94_07520 [Phycisphaerae bacterium]|nr:hypothetical protein [Phycisphaerae bacterium]
MSKQAKAGLAVGLITLACLGMGPPARTGIIGQPVPIEVVAVSKVPVMESEDYNLLSDSMFAEGCMGGGFGCMCPLEAASAFTGGLALTTIPRTPPGHHAYDVAVQDWLVIFDGVETQISGSGRYDCWTELSGASWQSMTLDLVIDGDCVHFSSGVLEDPAPSGTFPDEISISLDNDAECFGFIIALVAQRGPTASEAGGDDTPFGGYCRYTGTPGVATITCVEAPEPGDLNCTNDPVAVIFDFQPDDPASGGLAATGVRLTISEGENPPRQWAEGEGLIVGSQHACVRRDIEWGTCSPLLYEFPDVDYGAGIQLCYAASTFTMNVFPSMIEDAIHGQRVVLLTTVTNYGVPPAPEPVHITAQSDGAQVTIAPQYVVPGQVCEITAVPVRQKMHATVSKALRPVGDSPYGDGHEVVVDLRGERGGFAHSLGVGINVLPGEDECLEQASAVRDRFVPYLAANDPEFGITPDTQWTGTIVKPHILVVTHYLFFSDDWEMGVMWHNMIPPYDWAKIYLRHRYTDTRPQYAYAISSISAEPAEAPQPIDPPEQVDR